MPKIKNAPKTTICVVTAVALVGSAMSFKIPIALPVITCIGGIVVFRGLWIEKRASEVLETIHHETPRVQAVKKVENVGWWILMAGILAEIITAFALAARDVREEWKNSPMQQPVSTVEAVAQIILVSPQWLQPFPSYLDGTDLELTGTNVLMAFPYFWLIPHGVPLEAGINGFQVGKSNSIALTIEFNQGQAIPHFIMSNNSIDSTAQTVKEALSETKAMIFYIDYIPRNSLILTGQTVLKINGFTKTFTIPRQTIETNFGIFIAPSWQPKTWECSFSPPTNLKFICL